MKSAFKAAWLAFSKQVKANYVQHCKNVVAKSESKKPTTNKK